MRRLVGEGGRGREREGGREGEEEDDGVIHSAKGLAIPHKHNRVGSGEEGESIVWMVRKVDSLVSEA